MIEPASPASMRRRRATRRSASRADVPTLRDVARTAGVSTASASRALNRPESVSADLSARVTAAAAALGYVPNHAGRALSSLCSDVAGLLVADIQDPETSRMMAALQPALAEAGYALMVAAAGDVRAHELAQIRMLLQRGVDAIVLMGVPELGSLDTLPAARGVPRVHLGGGGSGLHWIGVDLVLAAATVAGFLRSLGHRQVATLGAARPKGMATAYLPALQRALAEAAIDATGEVAADGHDDFAAARVAIRELLQRGSSATAIVCDSDILAAGVVRECCEMGISVPDQVSVVGFGDLEIARRSQPTLTTIRIPFDEIGRHVVACLRAQIDAGTVHGRQLPGKLVARGSTAVAPT